MTRPAWTGVALAAAGLAGWLVWAAAQPAPLGDAADALATPANVKPEWYFLALYQLLQVMPERIGVLLPGMVGGALVLLPLWHPTADGRRHRAVQIVAALGVAAYVALTTLGYLSGPGP